MGYDTIDWLRVMPLSGFETGCRSINSELGFPKCMIDDACFVSENVQDAKLLTQNFE